MYLVWYNRICWHALMFIKHIIFQILYIIVGPLCPTLSNASFSTKSLLLTSAVCSDWPTGTVHCDWPNTTSRVGNVTALSIIASFSFQINVKTVNNVLSFTISSSPRGEQSRVTDTEFQEFHCSYVFAHKPIKTISDRLYTPLWCDPVSLSLSLSHTHTHTSRD